MPDHQVVQLDTALLAKVLGRLGSTHDGEVLAAARRAQRLLDAAGRSWASVLGAELAAGHRPIPSQLVGGGASGAYEPPIGGTWVATLLWLCERRAAPTDRANLLLDRWHETESHRLAAGERTALRPRDAAKIIAVYADYCRRAA